MTLIVETELVALDSGHGLVVRSFDAATIEFLNNQGLDGNGYTWTGIVDAIARMELASEHSKFSWSPEADELLVTCKDRTPLERLQSAVARYGADESLLQSAIDNADPEMMD
jgi:hypothetical protein